MKQCLIRYIKELRTEPLDLILKKNSQIHESVYSNTKVLQ